jgi:hypothetical protein
MYENNQFLHNEDYVFCEVETIMYINFRQQKETEMKWDPSG